MSGLVIAIRPEPGLSATLAAGRAMGLQMVGEALFAIQPLAWEAPDPAGFDGLLLGSANALRHFGPELALWAGKPAFVVGETTAQAARDAGLSVALVGEGYLQGVADRLTGENLRLLRVTGREHVGLQPSAGMTVETRVAYENITRPMSEALAVQVRGGALVLLHSAAAARHFAAECERLAIDRSGVSLAALGPRIAEAAGVGWRTSRVAPTPREPDLLALARDMCQ